MITSNKLTVTLNIETMGVTFNNGISTVNKNSYLHNVFAVQPTENLLPNETLWAVFESEGAVVETKDFILALREVTPLTDTQEVEGGTVTPSTANQEWYIDIPSEIMQNEGEWHFSLAIRVIDDKAKPDVFSQIATTGKYSFTILNSLIGAGADGTTPTTRDIASLYKTALGTVNKAQGYAENAQTYAEQAQGYAQELSGAIGEIDGFQQQLDNIVDGTTPVAKALNAQTANTAQTAQTANTAQTAQTAETAQTAQTANSAQTSATAQFAYEAGKATNDGDGNNIATTYATNTNLALKQNITDQTLNTTAKTIVGAINENATAIAGLQQDFVNEDHFKGFAQTAEDVQAITANLNDFAYCVATGTIWTYGASGWTNSNEPYPSDATPLSNTTPLQDGTATAGQSASAARGDHVHPTDTSRASATDLTAHVNDLNNPHEVTAEQVGAYVKPSGGIPETDLSTAVQDKLNDTYTLPVASETQLGGVKPVEKTSEMTQKVGVDSAGALWTNGGTTVVANPTLSGSEAELTGLEVGGKKYKVPQGGGVDYATTEDIDALFAPADELLGNWFFNESITANFDSTVISTRAPQPGTTIKFLLNFQSNSSDYEQFAVVYNGSHIIAVYYDNSPDTVGYDSTAFDGIWMDEAYRTITITDTSALTNREEFTTWLKANATKQGANTRLQDLDKAISLSNLQQFKQKCDETYAPIGGGGGNLTRGFTIVVGSGIETITYLTIDGKTLTANSGQTINNVAAITNFMGHTNSNFYGIGIFYNYQGSSGLSYEVVGVGGYFPDSAAWMAGKRDKIFVPLVDCTVSVQEGGGASGN